MKKITLLLFVLCTIVFGSFAQGDEPFFRPLQGDKTISFAFAGISNVALTSAKDPLNNAQLVDLRYFYKDNLAFRAGFGVKNLKTTTTTKNDSTGGQILVETELINNTTAFSIGLGAERHFKTKSKRIDPFGCASLTYSSLGDNTVTNTTKTTMPNKDYSNVKTETVTPGGHAFGIQASLGFFWYFAQSIALGGEIALGFVSGTAGGDITVNTESTTSVAGTVTSKNTTAITKNEISSTGIQTINAGNVILLVKF